jgi:uncharacterized damage-inducible protein DinB
MSRYAFLVDTYDTERLKILSVWSQVPDDRLTARTASRARSPLEHMIHQCISEDAWLKNLGLASVQPVTPADETKLAFIKHYAERSAERAAALREKPEAWFEELVSFYGERRSRAWVLVRRISHASHHRGQLLACLRIWDVPLYSTYGPTADTGGLPKNGATVIYRYDSIDALIAAEEHGGESPELPGSGSLPPTERRD